MSTINNDSACAFIEAESHLALAGCESWLSLFALKHRVADHNNHLLLRVFVIII